MKSAHTSSAHSYLKLTTFTGALEAASQPPKPRLGALKEPGRTVLSTGDATATVSKCSGFLHRNGELELMGRLLVDGAEVRDARWRGVLH